MGNNSSANFFCKYEIDGIHQKITGELLSFNYIFFVSVLGARFSIQVTFSRYPVWQLKLPDIDRTEA